MSVAVRRD